MIRRAEHPRPGFTLIDLLMTLTVILALGAIVLPRLHDDSFLRVRAAAGMLRSDLELAQVMTIANPADPVAVRLEGINGYSLLYPSSGASLRRPGGEAYTVTFGQGRALGAGGVTLSAQGITDLTVVFNELGGLANSPEEPVITLQHDTRWIRLTFSPLTGSITESSG
jgi:type II secretory pathway pseudopilin PulG